MKLAIYDFDGTYIEKQCVPILFKLWKKEKINPKSYRRIWGQILFRYVLYKLKIFGWDKRRFNPYAMKKTGELFLSVSKDRVHSFIDKLYLELQNHLSFTIKDQVKKDKENGYMTILLSGNLDMILNPFKKDGFDFIIGSIAQRDNQLLAKEDIHILIEDKKKEMIISRFPDANLEESRAYADSGYDLPVLKMVGHPFVINPDTELKQYAIKHDWPILKK